MENMQRRTFDTRFKALDGQRRVPTQDELDHMLYELVRDKLAAPDPDPDPGPTIPTETELRRKARELGLPVRPSPSERFRNEMLALFRAADEERAVRVGRASVSYPSCR